MPGLTKPVIKRYLQTAKTLSEALPYLRRFAGETFVIKYGGHAMGDAELGDHFARDVVLMKQIGPQIGDMLGRLGIESDFVDGLRVTDRPTVEIVEMVLSGTINKHIVTTINAAGGTAVGLSGKDGGLIEARKLERTRRDPDSNIEKVLDLGFVGEPVRIDPDLLDSFAGIDVVPVIAPIGLGAGGETYNINADSVAGAVAAAVRAKKLLMLTDVAGVLDQAGELVSTLTPDEAQALIEDATVAGGMIPKIETCIRAVREGTEAAHILDGRLAHVLLLEVFTEQGVGTMIRRD
jgi:acetylglutamate kinase